MFQWVLNTSPIIVSEYVSEYVSVFSIIISTLNQISQHSQENTVLESLCKKVVGL